MGDTFRVSWVLQRRFLFLSSLVTWVCTSSLSSTSLIPSLLCSHSIVGKEDEIEALERAGGNAIVNSIYEADLTLATFDKHVVLSDPEADAIARKDFIQKKYKELAYFDASRFQEQILAKNKDNDKHRKSDSMKKSKRSRSYEDMPLDSSFSSLTSKTGAIKSVIKDIIKKPQRLRSNSFQGPLLRLGGDNNEEEDEDDHTDEERSAYNLPGHLGVSKKDTTKKSKKKKGVQQRLRGSSLPKLMRAPSSERNRKESEAKRAPSSERTRAESTELRRRRRLSGSGSGTIPSQDDLGYGSSASMDKSSNSQQSDRTESFTDSSARKANRRRRSSLGSTASSLHNSNSSSSINSSKSINNTVHDIAVDGLDATARRSNRRRRSGGGGGLSSASSHHHRMDTSSQKTSSSRLSDSSNPRKSNRRRRGSMGSGSQQQQSQPSCTKCSSSSSRRSTDTDSCKSSSAPRAPRRAVSDDDNTIDGDDDTTTSCDSCQHQLVKPSSSFSSTASAKRASSIAASSRLANTGHRSSGKAPRAPRRLLNSDDDDSVVQSTRHYESDASQSSRAPQQPRRMMSDDDDSVMNATKPRRMMSDEDDSVLNAMKPRRMMSDDDDSVMNAMKPRRMMSDDDDSVMQAMKNAPPATTPSRSNSHLSQGAPRVPRRMISDDENSVISGSSVQKHTSGRFAPTSDHAQIMPRQPRRMSLPGFAKQKKDDGSSITSNDEDSIVQQYSNKKYTGIDVYSPHHKRRGTVENPFGKAAPKYGVKMGYGYESSVSKSSDSEQDGGSRNATKARHQRAHRRGSTGDGISAADAPALGCFLETSHVRPKKILDENSLGSATKSSNDDVAGIGPSSRQRVLARRRGSTGGALEMPSSSSSESLSNHFRVNSTRQLPMVPSLGGSSVSSGSGEISSGLSRNDPRWSFGSLSEHLNASKKPEKVVIKKGSNHSSDNQSVGVLSMLSGFSAVSEFTGFSFESKSSKNSYSSAELKFNPKAPRLSQLDEESTTSCDHNGSFAWATEYSVTDDPVPSLAELGYGAGEETTQLPNDSHVCLAESETLDTTWTRNSSSKRDQRLEDPMYSFVSLSQAFEPSNPQADGVETKTTTTSASEDQTKTTTTSASEDQGDRDLDDETTGQPPVESPQEPSSRRASRQGSCGSRLRSSLRASTSSGSGGDESLGRSRNASSLRRLSNASGGDESLGRSLNASSIGRLSNSSTASYNKSSQQQQGSTSSEGALLGDSSSKSTARESASRGKMLNDRNKPNVLQRQDSMASEASDIASVASDTASVASVVSEASDQSWNESLLKGTEGPPGMLSVLADESCSTTDSSLLQRCSSGGTTDEQSPSLCVGKPTIISDNHHSHPRRTSSCGGGTTDELYPSSRDDLCVGKPTIVVRSDNAHSHPRRTSSCGGGTASTDELSPSSKDNLCGGKPTIVVRSDNAHSHPRRSSSFGNTAA